MFQAGAHFAAPRPCDGKLYENWDVMQYALQAASEHGELAEALMEYREECTPDTLENVILEAVDVLVATTSLLNKLGINEVMRQNYIRKVNERNARRNGGKRFAH